MNIDWSLAGAVMLSGLSIVFLGLIILIIAVIIMGKIFGVKPKAKPPADPPKKAEPAAQQAAAPANPPAMAVQSGVPEEDVAVIAGAISYIMQETAPGVAFAVTDIQRNDVLPAGMPAAVPAYAAPTGGARPAWGYAGMQQNTRPF